LDFKHKERKRGQKEKKEKGVSQQILTAGRLHRLLTLILFGLGWPFHFLASLASVFAPSRSTNQRRHSTLFELVDTSRLSHFHPAAT
jgi:hypothetical protein